MSSRRIDACLALAAGHIGEALAREPEDQWFERKSVRVSPETFARALVGLANAEGGLVVVGISDGQIEDCDKYVPMINALRGAHLTFTAPPVRTTIEMISTADAQGKPCTLLCAWVHPGESVHQMSNGDCYLRVGDSTRRLKASQREELFYDRGMSQFEARPLPGLTLEHLDSRQVEAYRTAIGSTTSTPQLLHARSLLTQQDAVTVAAALLFAKTPQTSLPHAEVRLLKYATKERGTGTRQSLLEGHDVRLGGSIPQMIREAIKILDTWVPARRALRPDGTFGAIPSIPRDAWIEGLVNAVVHRSYSAAGDHIRVAVFPDRIEIESPGRFPGLVDPAQPLTINRYARNPRIARACGDLGITQELGEGIKRMFDEMRLHGLVDPTYTQTSGSVRLVLTETERLDPDVLARLPRSASDILSVLRQAHQPLGTGEVERALGKSRPLVLRSLNALQEEGLVSWAGKSPRDPHATWSLVE